MYLSVFCATSTYNNHESWYKVCPILLHLLILHCFHAYLLFSEFNLFVPNLALPPGFTQNYMFYSSQIFFYNLFVPFLLLLKCISPVFLCTVSYFKSNTGYQFMHLVFECLLGVSGAVFPFENG